MNGFSAVTDQVEMRLRKAVLIYSASGSHRIDDFRADSTYASLHDVSLQDGRPVIGAGAPATVESLAKLAAALAPVQESEFIPANVLARSPGLLVWQMPAVKRQVWFNTDASRDSIGARTAQVWHPALIFAVSRATSRWHVFAVKTRARATPDTPLYFAPYYNVWEGGAICTGNVQTPASIGADSIAAWEDAFFRSRFTHSNLTRGGTRHKQGLPGLWRDLLDGKHPQKFPTELLSKTRLTLGQLIQQESIR